MLSFLTVLIYDFLVAIFLEVNSSHH